MSSNKRCSLGTRDRPPDSVSCRRATALQSSCVLARRSLASAAFARSCSLASAARMPLFDSRAGAAPPPPPPPPPPPAPRSTSPLADCPSSSPTRSDSLALPAFLPAMSLSSWSSCRRNRGSASRCQQRFSVESTRLDQDAHLKMSLEAPGTAPRSSPPASNASSRPGQRPTAPGNSNRSTISRRAAARGVCDGGRALYRTPWDPMPAAWQSRRSAALSAGARAQDSSMDSRARLRSRTSRKDSNCCNSGVPAATSS
mmetsp:Transcript_107793/g.347798  ORF Transcript_107793/g.347798 Transcript_107793/m.347798 type:complete len:257 (+) Transcript_107793:1383-2153(+)